jgi:hypothetical protein
MGETGPALRAEIGGDIAEFQKAIADAKRAARSFDDAIGVVSNKVDRSLDKVGGSARKVDKEITILDTFQLPFPLCSYSPLVGVFYRNENFSENGRVDI